MCISKPNEYLRVLQNRLDLKLLQRQPLIETSAQLLTLKSSYITQHRPHGENGPHGVLLHTFAVGCTNDTQKGMNLVEENWKTNVPVDMEVAQVLREL